MSGVETGTDHTVAEHKQILLVRHQVSGVYVVGAAGDTLDIMLCGATRTTRTMSGNAIATVSVWFAQCINIKILLLSVKS